MGSVLTEAARLSSVTANISSSATRISPALINGSPAGVIGHPLYHACCPWFALLYPSQPEWCGLTSLVSWFLAFWDRLSGVRFCRMPDLWRANTGKKSVG